MLSTFVFCFVSLHEGRCQAALRAPSAPRQLVLCERDYFSTGSPFFARRLVVSYNYRRCLVAHVHLQMPLPHPLAPCSTTWLGIPRRISRRSGPSHTTLRSLWPSRSCLGSRRRRRRARRSLVPQWWPSYLMAAARHNILIVLLSARWSFSRTNSFLRRLGIYAFRLPAGSSASSQ